MNRKLIIGLVAVAACAALIEWSSCGSSSSATPTPTPADAPTISDVTISGGNAVHSTVDLTADPADPIVTNVSTATSSIVVTFTSTAAVTVPDRSVTLTCASGTAPTLGTPTSSDNVFTFAITGTFPELATCTLAFSAEITNGTPMVAVSKDFTTGCSTSDSFASTTTITSGTGCWTPLGTGFTSTISSATSGLVDTLTADPIQGNNTGSYKSFANGSATTSVTITNMSTTGKPICGIFYANQDLSSSFSLAVIFDLGVYEVFAITSEPISNAITLSAPPSTSAPLTLTVTAGTDSYSVSCSQSGIACGSLVIDSPQSIITEAAYIGLFFGGDAIDASCTFGDGTATHGFIVTGASATGPDPTGTTGGQD